MIFSTVYLKGDFLWRRKDKLALPKTIKQAYRAMEEYIFYNRSRFQEKRNGLFPVEYREKAAASYALFFIVYLTWECAKPA